MKQTGYKAYIGKPPFKSQVAPMILEIQQAIAYHKPAVIGLKTLLQGLKRQNDTYLALLDLPAPKKDGEWRY